MADLQKIIKILFEGDDQVSTTLRSVSGAIESTAGKLQSITGPLAELNAKILKAEAAFIGLAVAGMGVAIAAAGKFGDSFNEITTLFQATGEETDIFKNKIIDYGTRSTQSFEAINSAVYQAISLGEDYSTSLDLVSRAENLSVAGKGDLVKTLELLKGTMNAYGASVEDAERYSDVFFKTVQLGKTSIPELAASMSQITGVAAALGVPIETVSASLAALTAAGAPTSQAITGIKAAMSNMLKPSSAATEEAERLGISFDAAAVKSKGFEGVIQDVQRATNGNLESMGKLFGSVEGLNAVVTLGADKSGTFAKALGEMSNAAGATAEAADKMRDNFEFANQRIANSFNAVLITAGQELVPEYAKITGALANVFDGARVGLSSEAFAPVFEMISKFADLISERMNLIAKNLPAALEGVDFTGLTESFKRLGLDISESFKLMFPKADLSTVDGLREAIQGVVNILSNLNSYVGGVIDSFKWVFEWLGKMSSGFDDVSSATSRSAGQWMGYITQIDYVLKNIGILTTSLSVMAGSISLLAVSKTGLFGATVNLAGGLTALKAAASVALGPIGLLAAATVALYDSIKNKDGVTNKAAQGLIEWADRLLFGSTMAERLEASTKGVTAEVLRFKINMDDATTSQEKAAAAAKKVADDMKDVGTRLDSARMSTDEYQKAVDALLQKLGSEFKIDVKGMEPAEINQIIDTLQAKIDGKPLVSPIATRLDAEAALRTERELEQVIVGWRTDPDGVRIPIYGKWDQGRAREVAEDVENDVKILEKKLELQAKLDTEEIRANAEVLKAQVKASSEFANNALKFRAEINLAEIQAGVDRMKTLFGSLDSTFQSTGDVLAAAFGPLVDADRYSTAFRIIKEQIEDENKMRQEAHDMQMDMLALEKRREEIRMERELNNRGEMPEIKINMEGVEPALELVMWEIIEKVQLRASESMAEFLLGIPS